VLFVGKNGQSGQVKISCVVFMVFDPHTRTGSDIAAQDSVVVRSSSPDLEQYDGNRHIRNVMVSFPTSLGPKP
jgi:hypothetical protein